MSYVVHNDTAILLTGGGARAAWQAGVLKAISEWLPRDTSIPFPIICGTSAGAINAIALAAYADNFRTGISKLEWAWRHLTTDQVLEASRGQIFRQVFLKKTPSRSFAIIDNTPLAHLLERIVDFERITPQIEQGLLTAIGITASNFTNGSSVTFYQGKTRISDWYKSRRSGQRVQLTTKHILASSSLPFLFPLQYIAGDYYADGSIHQLAPLSAPLHLGAKRILVLSLTPDNQTPHMDNHQAPSASAIAGHLMDTIYSDTLNVDIEQLDRINKLLAPLPSKLVPVGTSKIMTEVITPTSDFQAEVQACSNCLPPSLQWLMQTLGEDPEHSTTLTSYLIFERQYTSKLIKMGYQDAQKHKAGVCRLLRLPNNCQPR